MNATAITDGVLTIDGVPATPIFGTPLPTRLLSGCLRRSIRNILWATLHNVRCTTIVVATLYPITHRVWGLGRQ
jgi:hypothetical protein